VTCPFVEVTGSQGLVVSVSDASGEGMFGIDNVDISAAAPTAATDTTTYCQQTCQSCAEHFVEEGCPMTEHLAQSRAPECQHCIPCDKEMVDNVVISTTCAMKSALSTASTVTLVNCRVQEGAVCVQCEHGYENHPETSSCEPHDGGDSGDVYHQAFDADADGTGAACSEWGGHPFSCGALGGICTNDHEDHHDHHDEEHGRGALSKTFPVRAGSYNVKLDFIQIDADWHGNPARVEVNGVVCWTQGFTLADDDYYGNDYGSNNGVTPGGLAQCKEDFEALHGPQGTDGVYCSAEELAAGHCNWYVARLIERQSL
jgi:hypothetical protein